MKNRALKDNKTLKITKGKIYTVWVAYGAKNLLVVENDNGDSVIMSVYEFEPIN